MIFSSPYARRELVLDSALPTIQIVPHHRAKRLKLTVTKRGIRLTIPIQAREQQILVFLQQHHLWLKNVWQKQQNLLEQAPLEQQLPTILTLAYHSDPIHIIVQDLARDVFQYQAQRQQLTLHLQYPHYALTQFVIEAAKVVLPPITMRYAQKQQLQVNKVRIATPSTRWGSCNHQQNIMLHAGLLLMPEDFADYVIWHELAHTKEMNHQHGFWNLLQQFYPSAKAKQQHVKKFRLPSWWQVKIAEMN